MYPGDVKKKVPKHADEHYLWLARGPDGCHADTKEALEVCRRLEAVGQVHEGPFKNLRGNPVFFAEDRGQYEPEDPMRPVFPGMSDYQRIPN